MLKHLLPRQEGFFELFQKSADKLVLTSTEFYKMLQDLSDQQMHVNNIAQFESEGDQIANDTFELLHKTFITPFDRHDIHGLTSQLDDVLDLINRCAQRFPFYNLSEVPEEMIQLAGLSVQATELLKDALYSLRTLKKSQYIFEKCDRINLVENKAHKVVLAGERKLFLEENNFKEFFKLKEIYAQTKLVINRCQDVANLIKGIVLEYS